MVIICGGGGGGGGGGGAGIVTDPIWSVVTSTLTVSTVTSLPINLISSWVSVAKRPLTLALRVDIISSWTVSRDPLESNISWALVLEFTLLFSVLSINLNVFWPVSHFGLAEKFGDGI